MVSGSIALLATRAPTLVSTGLRETVFPIPRVLEWEIHRALLVGNPMSIGFIAVLNWQGEKCRNTPWLKHCKCGGRRRK